MQQEVFHPSFLLHSSVLNVSIISNCNLDFHLFCGSSVVVVAAAAAAAAVAVVVDVVVVVVVFVFQMKEENDENFCPNHSLQQRKKSLLAFREILAD